MRGFVPILLLTASCAGGPDGSAVSRSEYETVGKLWPLTVDEAVIGCDVFARWVEVDGIRYGLNGFASTQAGYSDLTAVWSVDEELMAQLYEAGATDGPTWRVNIGDMSKDADAHCAD